MSDATEKDVESAEVTKREGVRIVTVAWPPRTTSCS
jgi:hypothetical protein